MRGSPAARREAAHLTMPATVTCILNSSAGAGRVAEAREHLARVFAENKVVANILVASGSDIDRQARLAVQQKSQMVVAGGGDGTVNTVAAALLGTQINMGVMPLGTLNHFAHDLHIPADLGEAAKTLVTGSVAAVDVAEVNGRIFVNNSSLGIYPRIVRERVQKQHLGYTKWIAFAQAVVWVLWRHSLLHVRLEADEKDLVRDTPFVFVGNNEYLMEGLKIGERKALNAGHLCVYTAQRVGRAGLLRLAFLALMGRLAEAGELDVLHTKEIWIKTRKRRIHVSRDGEVNVTETPLHYRIRPGALRVIVPATDGGEAAAGAVRP